MFGGKDLLAPTYFAVCVSGGSGGWIFVKLTGYALEPISDAKIGTHSGEIPRSRRQWNPRSRKARDLGHPRLDGVWQRTVAGDGREFGYPDLGRSAAWALGCRLSDLQLQDL